MQSRKQKLEDWAMSLSNWQTESLLVMCVEMLIESEEFYFYSGDKVPHWHSTGEHIDGTKREDTDAQ